MKKIISFIVLSIVSFISLTIISFNLSNFNIESSKEDSKINKPLQTISKIKINNKKFPESDDVYIIKDFKANVENNQVTLTWSNSSIADIENIKIIRTPLKGEGIYAVYDVYKASGKYIDKNVKQGMLYYYEITGKTKKGIIYSGLITAKIPGNVEFSTEYHYMIVNGEKIYYDSSKKSKPFISKNTIMIPVKGAAEIFGAKVDWTKRNGKINTKSAIFIFNNTEIELFVGESNIMVNRKSVKIEAAPVIIAGVLYTPYSIIEKYINCSVTRDGGNITITKDTELDDIKRKELYEDITIEEGENLEITLEDAQTDGEKWHYSISESDVLELQSKTVEKGLGNKYNTVFNFKTLKKGKFKLVMKYFNPRFGDIETQGILFYNLNVT